MTENVNSALISRKKKTISKPAEEGDLQKINLMMLPYLYAKVK